MTVRLICGSAMALALAALLDAAPVCRYAFDETAGTTAADTGSSGANGVIGSNLVKGAGGVFGTAFTFNNDATQAGIVDMGNATGLFNRITTSQAVTISVWLKWTTAGTRDSVVFLGDSTSTNRYLDVGTVAATGGVYARVRSGLNSGYPDLTPTPAVPLNDGRWHHIAFAADVTAGAAQLYVDGVLVAHTTTAGFTFPSPLNNFEVGRLGRSGPTDAFAGSVDELRIYDGVLSVAEIQALTQAPPGDPSLAVASMISLTSNGQPGNLLVPFSNGGATLPLTLTEPVPVEISGPDAAFFHISSFDNHLSPGASGSIRLGFDPTLAGGGVRNYDATLTIHSNDSRQPQATSGIQVAVDFGSADVDGDGLPDNWEIFYGLDPEDNGSANPVNGASGDPDNDGLTNSEELFLGSDPRQNQSGKAWLPRPGKVALMFVSTHPDDEGIFFGGAIPYYARTKNLATLLVSMTSGDWTLAPPERESELRNAAWTYGIRYQPLFPRFRDVSNSVLTPYANKIDATWDYWADGVLQNDGSDVEAGKMKAVRYLAGLFRKYRPEIVVTHDLNGEYGHLNHMATAWAVTQALDVAADPARNEPELGLLPPWQIKKLYIHKYPYQRLFHDYWEAPSINDGGVMKSPREITNLGLDYHVTQGRPKVSTVYATGEVNSSWAPHPSEWWGLYQSTVGPDAVKPDFVAPDANNSPITYAGWARGDFLENLTIYPDHDGDGLADDWELSYFAGLADANPAADDDGDGLNNLDEFLCGLNPRSADRIQLLISGDGRRVDFNVPGTAGAGYQGLTRHYRLRHSPDLANWGAVVAEGVADGGAKSYEIPSPSVRGFYRLEIFIR